MQKKRTLTDTDLHKTFTLSIFVSFKELKIERKGSQVLSFPRDCAAGQEAFGQLLIDNDREGVQLFVGGTEYHIG